MEANATASANILADYISGGDLAVELEVSVRTLQRWARLGEAPPVTKIGRKLVYRRSAVQDWLARREAA